MIKCVFILSVFIFEYPMSLWSFFMIIFEKMYIKWKWSSTFFSRHFCEKPKLFDDSKSRFGFYSHISKGEVVIRLLTSRYRCGRHLEILVHVRSPSSRHPLRDCDASTNVPPRLPKPRSDRHTTLNSHINHSLNRIHSQIWDIILESWIKKL
jgi:hypothetical protein